MSEFEIKVETYMAVATEQVKAIRTDIESIRDEIRETVAELKKREENQEFEIKDVRGKLNFYSGVYAVISVIGAIVLGTFIKR